MKDSVDEHVIRIRLTEAGDGNRNTETFFMIEKSKRHWKPVP
jgi:hypothetical protein